MERVRTVAGPRMRFTPEELARLKAHVERYKRSHPSATVSAWVRDAINKKLEAETPRKKAK